MASWYEMTQVRSPPSREEKRLLSQETDQLWPIKVPAGCVFANRGAVTSAFVEDSALPSVFAESEAPKPFLKILACPFPGPKGYIS